jgi:ATP-binding cassette, subfamily C (CFTR/MRP), member 1
LFSKALYCLLGASQLGFLGLLPHSGSSRTNLTTAAAVVSLLSTVGLTVTSMLDGQRTIAPSTTIQAFMLFTTLFDTARLRTLVLLDIDAFARGTFAATIAFKALLLVAESRHKISHAKGLDTAEISIEKSSGLFSRSLLLWLNPLIVLGNRKTLEVGDMYEVDAALRGRTVDSSLSIAWALVADPSRENALYAATMRAFRVPYLLTLIPSLGLTFFSLLQPLLISRVIRFVQDPTAPPERGHGLVGGYVAVYLGLMVCTAWNGNLQARFLARLRGGLVALVYRAMLAVRAESKAGGKAMQMMGAEVERILAMQVFVLNVVPAMVQIVFGVVVLSTQLGVLCLVPVGITLGTSANRSRISLPSIVEVSRTPNQAN